MAWMVADVAEDEAGRPDWREPGNLPTFTVTAHQHVPGGWLEYAGQQPDRVRVVLSRFEEKDVTFLVAVEDASDPRLRLGATWKLVPDERS